MPPHAGREEEEAQGRWQEEQEEGIVIVIKFGIIKEI